MRSRTVREGSVGLLILLSLFLFGGLVLWIRGMSVGSRSYTIVAEFVNAGGMQVGAPVRYRGVNVGKITAINPGSNGVDVVMEIARADLLIPRNVVVEANQSGLLSETSIDITPVKPLQADVKVANPLDPRCQSSLIVCDEDRLQGQIGVSFDELIRSTTRTANLYSDPVFFANLNSVAKNTSVAALGVSQLTRELTGLSRSVQQEIKNFSVAANSVTSAANQTSNQVGLAANQISKTANQYSVTATQLNRLVDNMNSLVVANRSTLVSTLNNFSQASEQLRLSASTLTGQVNQFGGGQLRRNLELLSANAAQASINAAQASANFRDLSTALNSPTNLVVLQQTLDSARMTFENAQKITSDLDDLTGDEAFRNNLRNLVNGLSNLVSSTEDLQQQVQVAEVLEPVSTTVNQGTGIGTQQKNSLLPLSSPSLTPIAQKKQLKSVQREPIGKALPSAYWDEESIQPLADSEKKN
ncbi:MAG: MlaD family protein [Cyanobacteriota bacterium]